MAQNKNLIYVALGLGAGVFAYYYFCRRKYTINGNGDIVPNGNIETSNVDPSNPTGRELAPPPISKPITFIKELVSPSNTSTGTSATNTTSTTPVIASVEKPSTTPVSTPVLTNVSTPVSTPILTNVSTPVSTPVTTSVTTPVTTSVTTSVDKPVVTPVDKPAIAEVVSKEIKIEPTRTITDIKTSEPIKVGFDGMGQMCFEVGDCLYDL